MVVLQARARARAFAAKMRGLVFVVALLFLNSRTGASSSTYNRHRNRRWPLEVESGLKEGTTTKEVEGGVVGGGGGGGGGEATEATLGAGEKGVLSAAARNAADGSSTTRADDAAADPRLDKNRPKKITTSNGGGGGGSSGGDLSTANDGEGSAAANVEASTSGDGGSAFGGDDAATPAAVATDAGGGVTGGASPAGGGGEGGGAEAETSSSFAPLGGVDHLRNSDGTLAFPADITGTFKGKWTLVDAMGSDGAANGTTGGRLPGMKAFLGEGGGGVVVLQMTSKWDGKKNVQWVHGEVALRDGSYITESDLHLHMEGVYSEPTGMVNLVSQSRIDHVFKRGAGLMRGIVTGGGGNSNNNNNNNNNTGGDGDGSAGGDANYREALRIAGRDIIGSPWDLSATESDALRPEHVPGSPGLSQLQRAERLRHDPASIRTTTTPHVRAAP